MPENHAGAFLLLVEEVQFVTQYAVIDVVHSTLCLI
jgi:hypothetical protein